jgi:hypothetical protein
MTPKQKRAEIKRLLSCLQDKNRYVFNLMYAPNNKDQDVNITVDEMPAKQLTWALQQCTTSYHQIFDILKS